MTVGFLVLLEQSEESSFPVTHSRALEFTNRSPSFQTHALGRIGAVDKPAFVELAHDAIIDHLFDFDLAHFWSSDFHQSLHVAQAFQRERYGLRSTPRSRSVSFLCACRRRF